MHEKSCQWAAVIAGLALVSMTGRASAHDFWIEPSTFHAQTGERVSVGLCIGDPFAGWSMARNGARIEQFLVVGPAGERAIVGLDGSDPAGVTRLDAPGFYVLAYRSNDAYTELPPAKFAEYLLEKGLDDIAAGRMQQRPSDRPVREAYARYAKSLLRAGDVSGAPVDRRIGFRFEILAEPSAAVASGERPLTFRLLFEGKPLANAQMTATRRGAPESRIKARTDTDGRALLALPQAGVWQVASVHMIEAPKGVVADYESLWASLTLEMPSQSPIAPAPAASLAAAHCDSRPALAASLPQPLP